MRAIIQIIRECLGKFTEEDFSRSFLEFGIDSFSLMELRSALECHSQCLIPDSIWEKFTSFQDIKNYCNNICDQPPDIIKQSRHKSILPRTFSLNIPQMAFFGLSENWLLKELGDYHWQMICRDLQVSSSNLEDASGRRLYAAFVRIRLESPHHMGQFQENEKLTIEGNPTRFGGSLFFSNNRVFNNRKNIIVSMMTTFSYREADNSKLQKGQPDIPEHSQIENQSAMPAFGEEYSKMRKKEKTILSLGDQEFQISRNILFEMEYSVNPYRDLNGVNLLYFASYPIISDVCEIEYIRRYQKNYFTGKWPFERFVLFRDIYYYANCNWDDSIVFRLHYFESVSDRKYKITTSLSRKSDNKLMAEIFTVKSL